MHVRRTAAAARSPDKKISGRAHSSGGLLHGDNHRIPSAVPTFFSHTDERARYATMQA